MRQDLSGLTGGRPRNTNPLRDGWFSWDLRSFYPAQAVRRRSLASWLSSFFATSLLFWTTPIIVQHLSKVNKKFGTFLPKVLLYFCAFFWWTSTCWGDMMGQSMWRKARKISWKNSSKPLDFVPIWVYNKDTEKERGKKNDRNEVFWNRSWHT